MLGMLACRLDPHEAWMLANATRFAACAFRGRYERAECADLKDASAAAGMPAYKTGTRQ